MFNAAFAVVLLAPIAGQQATPDQVFEKRIAPIFKSPNPSSCVQCHLAGVDLKNYIRPSSKETFLSLRDRYPDQDYVSRPCGVRESARR